MLDILMSFAIGLFLGCLLLAFLSIDTKDKEYKRGQIDCINGKIQYELRGNPIWHKKEKAE